MGEYASDRKSDIDAALTDLNMEELIGNEMRLLSREYDKHGLVLSGGQQQKIAVSRLNFASFDIALLDEPSAALDPISSHKMLNTIMCKMKDKTMLMVSHDMSFSKLSDKIMFFEDGKLAEIGSHSELIENNQKYADFFKCQAESFNEKMGTVV